jgi:hypothetical protein
MLYRRELWKYLKCSVTALVAQMIGRSVVDAIQSYKKSTGKQASTVVIRFNGDLPQDPPPTGADSGSYTQTNQEHFIFTVKVE